MKPNLSTFLLCLILAKNSTNGYDIFWIVCAFAHIIYALVMALIYINDNTRD